jgi:hypothetical protein
MGITLRNVTGSALTYNQMDENFRFLSQSYFYLSGSNTGNASFAGSFTFSGSTVFSGSTIIDTSVGNFFVTDDSSADPLFIISSTAMAMVGTSSFIGPTSINGTTRITGSTNISGSTTITGSLRVSGSTIINGPTTITGSTIISGTLLVPDSIDSNNRFLADTAGITSVNWRNRTLEDPLGIVTVDWNGLLLKDSADVSSIDWGVRELYDLDGVLILNYSTSSNPQFYGTSSFATTASSVTPLNQNVIITGSLIVSGSGTFTNIGPAVFTGSMTTSGSNTLIGVTSLTGSVNISGSTSFIGTHTLSGSNTITGNTVLSGSIIVSGSTNFSNTIFTVTGSQFYTGSSVYIGNQTITGSLSLTSNGTGTGLFINGQKQFNFLSAYHTASITPTQNVSGSFIYSTLVTSSGITIENNSRITFANTGIYNIQFSVQTFTQTGATIDIWFKRNGVNIANSATKIGPTSNNTYHVPAWNFVDTFTSGSYVEIAYQSDQSNTEFQYIAAAGNIPAIPSIIVTVTQVA